MYRFNAPSASAASRGFTLIELLVVMLILSISLSIVLPLTMQQIESSRHRAERTKVSLFISRLQSLGFFGSQEITLMVSGRTMSAAMFGREARLGLDYVSFDENEVVFNAGFLPESIELSAYINERPWRLVVSNEKAEWFNAD
jgi:prepilin-type N-terminal cleavage/methylation domain-containing protein